MAGMTTLTAHTATLDVPGGRLAYDVAGDGPPLLLVHAGVTDRRMWDDVWDGLARTHTVIRHDTRGFGETVITDPAVAYSNRADIVALLDHLGIERAALCGVSRAGSIVIDTALESPDRVSALIPVAQPLPVDAAQHRLDPAADLRDAVGGLADAVDPDPELMLDDGVPVLRVLEPLQLGEDLELLRGRLDLEPAQARGDGDERRDAVRRLQRGVDDDRAGT